MPQSPGEIGQRIKGRRETKGWSRTELARKARVPYSTLAGLENGDSSTAKVETLEAIAKALGTSVDELTTREGAEKPKEPQLSTLLTEAELALLTAYRSASARNRELIDTYVEGISQRISASKGHPYRKPKTSSGIGEDSPLKKRKAL